LRQEEKYYIVHEDALPLGLKKVCQTRMLLMQGKARTIQEAVELTGISRSAYYKYRNSIKPFSRAYQDHILTLQAVLTDKAGVLSNFLNMVAKAGANVLTVNQTIPVNGAAGITLSVNTAQMKITMETLTKKLLSIQGVESVEILLGE